LTTVSQSRPSEKPPTLITIAELVAGIVKDAAPDLAPWEVSIEVHRQITMRAVADALTVFVRPYNPDGTLGDEMALPLERWVQGLRFCTAGYDARLWQHVQPIQAALRRYGHDLFLPGSDQPVYGEVKCHMEDLERPFPVTNVR
jgi:hypothetical protein